MLTVSQIKKLPVVTVSGKKLGRVNEVFVDPESQSIMQYQVKPHRLLSLDLPLLIHRSQVVSITVDRLLVEDNVVKEVVERVEPIIVSPISQIAATTTLARDEG